MAGIVSRMLHARGEGNPLQITRALDRSALRGKFGKGGKAPHAPSAAGREGRAQFPTMPRFEWPVDVPYPVPDKWLVVPGIAELDLGTTSAGYQLSFAQGAGVVLGWSCCVKAISDQVLAASSMAARLEWNGQEATILNGTGADYLLFQHLRPSSGPPYAPLMVEVTREDNLQVYFRNYSAANRYTPDCAFAFMSLERLRRYLDSARR